MANSDISIGFQAQGVTDLARQFSLVKKQIQSVEAPLVGATSKFKAFEKASITAGGAFRNIRAPIQNAAFQVQDIAVQLTMGTNSALVLAQQLPQLVSGFGALGAVIGGVVAVGAGIVMAFQNTANKAVTVKDKLGELQSVMSALRSTFNEVTQSTDKLEEKYGSLANEARELSIELLEIQRSIAISTLRKEIEDVPKSLSKLSLPLKTVDQGFRQLSANEFNLILLNQALDNVKKQFNLTGKDASRQAQILEAQFRNLNKALTEGGGEENTRNALMLLKDTMDSLGIPLQSLPLDMQKLMEAFVELAIAQAEMNKLLDDSTKATEKLASAEEDLTSLYLTQAEVAQRTAELESLKAKRRAEENDRAVQAIREQEEENARRAQELEQLKAKRRAEANDRRVEEERRINQRLLKEQEEHNKKVADSLLALEQLKAKRRAEANDKAVEEMRRQQQEQEDAQERLNNIISSGFEDAFMSVIDGSKKAGEAFRDFARMVIKQILKIALTKAVFEPIGNALGSAISGAFGISGQKAMGGPVLGGKTYMVGERGPELFTPRSSGQITPNHRMGGSGEQIVINQNINVTTGVQQTVRAEILGLMPQITEASKMAVIDAKRRGGSFAGAF